MRWFITHQLYELAKSNKLTVKEQQLLHGLMSWQSKTGILTRKQWIAFLIMLTPQQMSNLLAFGPYYPFKELGVMAAKTRLLERNNE